MGLTYDFLIRTAILTCLFSNVLAAPSIKRAVPNPNDYYSTVRNKTDTASTKYGHEDDLIQTGCPAGQLLQPHGNQSICCRPVICEKGFEIRTCSDNGGEDECVACQEWYIQLNEISSFNITETACFEDPYPNRTYCPIGDTKPSRDQPVNCAMYCECKTEDCYVGNPCGCTGVGRCGLNQQLNKHTKECEACPAYSYKQVIGCGGCSYNLTAFSLGVTIETSTPAISSSVTVTRTSTASFIQMPNVTSMMPKVTNVMSTGTSPVMTTTGIIILVFSIVIVGLLAGIFISCCVTTHPVRCSRLSQKMCPNESSPSSYNNSSRTGENSHTLTVDVPCEIKPLLKQTPDDGNKIELANRQDSGFGSSPHIENGTTVDASVSSLTNDTLLNAEPDTLDNNNKSAAMNFSETGENKTNTLDGVSRPELSVASLRTIAESNIQDETDIECPSLPYPRRELNGENTLKSKTETPRIKPVARVGPFTQPPASVDQAESELSSSMTSYPSIANYNSVGRMDDCNSMLSDFSTTECQCNSEGHLVTGRHSPDGVSAPRSHGHETASKQLVQSDETPLKCVYNDQVSNADVTSANNLEKNLMTKAECFKEIEMSGTHDIADMSTETNLASNINCLSEKETHLKKVVSECVMNKLEEDSFSAFLPSDSSVEISLSETQCISDDASVEIDYTSAAHHDQFDTQSSVISPNCVRETGDGADSECQDSVELDTVSSL